MLADSVAEFGALVGDPARARMLVALFDSVEMRATDLARSAGVSAQTTSFHLNKLCEAGILVRAKRGRWRVYSLAGPEVAGAIEAVIAITPVPRKTSPARDLTSIALARTCYDHLAGRLGVALADALQRCGWLDVADAEYAVTAKGEEAFLALGVDVAAARGVRRQFAKRCLDWTERRYHVAGALGAAIAAALRRRKWIVPVKASRVLHITSDGYRGLRTTLGVTL